MLITFSLPPGVYLRTLPSWIFAQSTIVCDMCIWEKYPQASSWLEFAVGVYLPNWFKIKVYPRWIQGPRHVLHQLMLLRSQCRQVVNIVVHTIQHSAWHAYSESVLPVICCAVKMRLKDILLWSRLWCRRWQDELGETYENTQSVSWYCISITANWLEIFARTLSYPSSV